jgi:hypothetical protein
MTRKPLVDDTDRGVSDVIAFTIVFGIIITSVGLVSVVGFQSLQEIERNEQGLNAQRAFQAVSDNLAELQGGQTPARTSEVDPRDGTIRIAGGPEVTVTVDSNGTVLNTTSIADVGSLTYSIPYAERTIGIQSSAVFNAQGGNAAIIESPKFVCRDSGTETSAIVSVLQLVPVDGPVGKSGGDVQIRASYNATSRLAYTNTTGGSKNVSVEVVGSSTSQFASAWDRGIARSDGSGGWTDAGSSPPTVECQDVDNVIVRVTVADVELR